MPSCFSLTPNKPMPLNEIDDRMRRHFGVEPDSKLYYRGWYDLLGPGLASGMTWTQLRETYPRLIDIIDYLEENYAVQAWYER